MSRLDYKFFYRRYLPHLQPLGGTFFITFRLAGSLPKSVLERWDQEKRQAARSVVSRKVEEEMHRRHFREMESLLHKAEHGPLWLGQERIADIVAEGLRYRDGKVYRLDAYCIMPNHVHIVFAPMPESEQEDYSLAKILQSLKGRTARKSNQSLDREGAFWEHESYDHCVRDEEEWGRTVAYVLNNPVKAGLVRDWKEWKWNYFRCEEK
jgi:REP element-mobilizing transposase RayT